MTYTKHEIVTLPKPTSARAGFTPYVGKVNGVGYTSSGAYFSALQRQAEQRFIKLVNDMKRKPEQKIFLLPK